MRAMVVGHIAPAGGGQKFIEVSLMRSVVTSSIDTNAQQLEFNSPEDCSLSETVPYK
jgi:hypothetical protein